LKKKILISGGNGFIGSYLKKSFIENGHSVVSIGRSKLNEICVDLAKNHIYHSDDYEYVIHAAGVVHNKSHSSRYDSVLYDRDLTITNNFIRTIENCTYVKIIFLSSVAVYGLSSGINICESQICKPKSSYSKAKLMAEKILTKFAINNSLIIFRLPLVLGPNPKGNLNLVDKKIRQGVMFIFKSNKSIKSVLELEDLFKIINDNLDGVFGIYNLKSYDIEFNKIIINRAKKINKKVKKLNILFFILIKIFVYPFTPAFQALKKMTTSLTFSNKKYLDDKYQPKIH
jgi:nucleoside-diphosphate-sugar epimerase